MYECKKVKEDLWACAYQEFLGFGKTHNLALQDAVDKYDKALRGVDMGVYKEQVTDEMEATDMDIDEVLEARGKRYGEYRKVAMTSQMFKDICHTSSAWQEMEHYQQESMDMICNKLARICCGDPYYEDSWKDIAGYATLVSKELEKL